MIPNRLRHAMLVATLTSALLTGAASAQTMTVGAAQRLYTSYDTGTASDLSRPVLRKNATEFYSWSSNGQFAFAKFSGPITAPNQTTHWEGYAGRWNFTGFPSGYRPWLGNIHKHTDGTLIGFVHIETAFWQDPDCKYRQGIAVSTDNGDTWRYCGDVIKHTLDGLTGQRNMGGCAAVIVKDGGVDYFYQYFNEYRTGFYRYPAVARAPVADVIAAAKTFAVSPWVKYNAETGGWNQNALTQSGTSILPYPSDRYDAHGDATYCAPLGKYLMVVYEQTGWNYINFTTSDANKGIYMYSSTDGVNWADKRHVFTPAAGGDACYPFFLGLTGASDDSFVVGENFQLYIHDRERDELYTMPITITGGTTPTPPSIPTGFTFQ